MTDHVRCGPLGGRRERSVQAGYGQPGPPHDRRLQCLHSHWRRSHVPSREQAPLPGCLSWLLSNWGVVHARQATRRPHPCCRGRFRLAAVTCQRVSIPPAVRPAVHKSRSSAAEQTSCGAGIGAQCDDPGFRWFVVKGERCRVEVRPAPHRMSHAMVRMIAGGRDKGTHERQKVFLRLSSPIDHGRLLIICTPAPSHDQVLAGKAVLFNTSQWQTNRRPTTEQLNKNSCKSRQVNFCSDLPT